MTKLIIPDRWKAHRQEAAYFITYYGEIYYGTLHECPGYDMGFFIIQRDKRKQFDALAEKDKTPNLLNTLGREIRDQNIIVDVIEHEEFTTRLIDFQSFSIFNTEKYKRMFVFGAGASKYCLPAQNHTSILESDLWPPLGNEVFYDRYTGILEAFEGAASYCSQSNTAEGVEKFMQKEWEQFKYYYCEELSAKHINVRFYLSKLLAEVSSFVNRNYGNDNLYGDFLTHVKQSMIGSPQERCSVVSFNYDAVLEHQITEVFGYQFQDINEYINSKDRNLVLFKPHGSCNWGWKLNDTHRYNKSGDSLQSRLYNSKTSPAEIYYSLIGDLKNVVALNTWGYEMHNDPSLRGRFTIDKSLIQCIANRDEANYWPAIQIPYEGKDEFYMPYDHFEAMKHVLDWVEELYVIGWKGNEALFNKMLKNATRLKKLIIVNPDSGMVEAQLQPFLPARHIEVESMDTFEDFVKIWIPSNW